MARCPLPKSMPKYKPTDFKPVNQSSICQLQSTYIFSCKRTCICQIIVLLPRTIHPCAGRVCVPCKRRPGVWRSWLAYLHGVQVVVSSSLTTPTNSADYQLVAKFEISILNNFVRLNKKRGFNCPFFMLFYMSLYN